MKKHLIAHRVALSLAARAAEAKTFTWTSSLDALSMDPYSTNNSFTNHFMNNIYEGLVALQRKGADRAGACRVVADGESDRVALQPAPEREVPQRRAVHRRRRRVQLAAHADAGLDHQADSRRRQGCAQGRRVYTSTWKRRRRSRCCSTNLLNLTIMSKSWCEANNATEATDLQQKKENYANRNANGTGPFMLKSREVDVKTVLAANPNWWDKPGTTRPKSIFTPIKSDATRTVLAAVRRARRDRQRARCRTCSGSIQLRELHRGPGSGAAHALPRHGPVPRRAPVLRRQGQEPVQGRSRTARRCTRRSTSRRSSAR